jgi:iron complex outermembrane receptor protein
MVFLRVWILIAGIFALASAYAQIPTSDSGDKIEGITVTARKRDESALDVPISLTIFSDSAIEDYGIQSFSDYAKMVPNLSYAFGNSGTAGNPATGISSARTIAIRGLAGARTTGFYVDDTPLPGALDVRVVDLEDIEVLKGPQGTLFGESSLGGNIRLITRKPDFDGEDGRAALYVGRVGESGGFSGGGEVAANVVLAENEAALRVVGVADRQGGFMTRSYLSDIADPNSARIAVGDQAAHDNFAGSVTARFRLGDRAEVTLRLMRQDQYDYGFPAAYAPLPEFRPVYVLDHIADIQPKVADRWSLPSLAFSFAGDGWVVKSSTGLFVRRTLDREDSTEGTAEALVSQLPLLPPPQPYAWTALYSDREITHETRISTDPDRRLSLTAGLFYSANHTNYSIPSVHAFQAAGPPLLLWEQSDLNFQQNLALFGEIYARVLDGLTLTLGDRFYRLHQSDDAAIHFYDQVTASSSAGSSAGNSPKIAVDYRLSDQTSLYLSAANGFRQGNRQFDVGIFGCESSLAAIGETAAALRQISPDAVWSYEAGAKSGLSDAGLFVSASAFHIDWTRVQQPFLLQSCGLFMVGNAGAAAIDGGEFELSGPVAAGLKFRASLGYEYGRVTKMGDTGQAVGSPIFQVPQWTASLGAVYSHELDAALKGFLSFDWSYSGSSLSANSGASLSLVRPAYSLIDAGAGLQWGPSRAELAVSNLTNEKPNLGDITYIGYGRYVPGTSTPIPQVATLPPRTWTLRFRRDW